MMFDALLAESCVYEDCNRETTPMYDKEMWEDVREKREIPVTETTPHAEDQELKKSLNEESDPDIRAVCVLA